jgi:hypothetical protein
MPKVDEDTSHHERIHASLARIHAHLDAPRVSFGLGRIVATPGAMTDFTEEERRSCLARHAAGSWGDVGPDDRNANDAAIKTGARILSSYCFDAGRRRLWLITEATGDDDTRALTTLLTPEES